MYMDERFTHQSYVIKDKPFKFLGRVFNIFDPNGNPILFAESKALKLLTEVSFFDSDKKLMELLALKPRKIAKLNYAYDLFDTAAGEKVGSFSRNWEKSVIKDSWTINDPMDQEVGFIQEDSTAKKLLRDLFLATLISQNFTATVNGQPAVTYKRHAGILGTKMTVNFTPMTGELLDRRLSLAAAILLLMLEGNMF